MPRGSVLETSPDNGATWVAEPTERYPDCPRHPHGWVDCPGDGPEDHDPSRPMPQPTGREQR